MDNSEKQKRIRATDAKEVGVKDPAEETYCYPNQIREQFKSYTDFVNTLIAHWVHKIDLAKCFFTNIDRRVDPQSRLPRELLLCEVSAEESPGIQ